jgi:uncharacterized MAPEG superfamily protein
MSLELQVLGGAAVLFVVQLCLLAIAANLQVDTRLLMGPRDEGVRLTGVAGRLQRAYQNHLESLVLYAVAVLLLELGGGAGGAGGAGGVSGVAALVYLAARVLYVPTYAFGLTPWRSLIWAVGFLAALAVLAEALI